MTDLCSACESRGRGAIEKVSGAPWPCVSARCETQPGREGGRQREKTHKEEEQEGESEVFFLQVLCFRLQVEKLRKVSKRFQAVHPEGKAQVWVVPYLCVHSHILPTLGP